MIKTSVITAFTVAGLAASTGAATIGAGVGILGQAGANNQVDTPSDGSTDQSRQNLDLSFSVTLDAGTYFADTWEYNSGQAGSVTPYLAVSNGAGGYEMIAVGSLVGVTDGFDVDTTVAFGGSDTFTLTGTTEVFAGITNPPEAGSQNPVYTNLASGGLMDHDNNVDGAISLAVLGGTVDGFGHSNLPRSYAFSVNVEAVPEPSPVLLFGLGGVLLFGMRRRR